jgi:heterodisulfide reductase subunit B
VRTRQRVNEALEAADLSYEGDLNVRYACEVPVNDVGLDKIKEQVKNPLTDLKVAGYLGCQTVRPFAVTDTGGNYDTYDQPEFLDDFVTAYGAEALDYDPKTSCSGGSVSVYSPEKALHLIKKIVQSAVELARRHLTPCPLCQQNVEMYQDAINKEFGTNFNIPVVFYSQLMAVAFGMHASKEAALDHNMIKALKLAELAKKGGC